MKKSILVAVCAAYPLFLFGAEPSAFGAGDLSNPQPYGLTSNEKVILETKKKLHKIALKSNNQENEVDSLRERIDGLQSVIESLSRKAHTNKVALQKLQEENRLKTQDGDEYLKRLNENVQSNTEEVEKIKKALLELSTLLDSINKDYVTKAEFNRLVSDVNAFKESISKGMKHTVHKGSKSKKSSATLYNEAKKYYDKKYYTKAIENYEILIKRNYKPAYAHYMIGEMNYKRKNYANALSYYKKSTKLYAKASYMPTLMLHSAISMHKTGDKKHARLFFEAIVKKYPKSKEAKEAQKYL